MPLWKRAMDYLGLGPDDAYDDYDMPPVEPERPLARGRGYEADLRPVRSGRDDFDDLRPPARQQMPRQEFEPLPARPRPTISDDSGIVPRPARQGSAVRSVPAPAGEPYTVRPRNFNHAQEVADKFMEGNPVIMNIEGTDREVSRRLIDFASGLCYGLGGKMDKVANGVYLLKPAARDYD